VMRKRRSRGPDLRRGPLEEGGDLGMPLAPLRSRQCRVRDVADEHVLEAELLVATKPRDRLAPYQVTSFERVEQPSELELTRVHLLEGAAPEDLADDGRVEENGALAGRERVEPGGHDRADRRR